MQPEARAKDYGRGESWAACPNPAHHRAAELRHRMRGLAYRHIPATTFLFAHPTIATEVSTALRQTILCLHLGLPVYDFLPLKCDHCNQNMDALGDHAADLCPAGFGRTHRHNSLRNVIAYHVDRAAALDC